MTCSFRARLPDAVAGLIIFSFGTQTLWLDPLLLVGSFQACLLDTTTSLCCLANSKPVRSMLRSGTQPFFLLSRIPCLAFVFLCFGWLSLSLFTLIFQFRHSAWQYMTAITTRFALPLLHRNQSSLRLRLHIHLATYWGVHALRPLLCFDSLFICHAVGSTHLQRAALVSCFQTLFPLPKREEPSTHTFILSGFAPPFFARMFHMFSRWSSFLFLVVGTPFSWQARAPVAENVAPGCNFEASTVLHSFFFCNHGFV